MVKSPELSRAESGKRATPATAVYLYVASVSKQSMGGKNNAPARNDYYHHMAINFNVLARFRPGRLLLLLAAAAATTAL